MPVFRNLIGQTIYTPIREVNNILDYLNTNTDTDISRIKIVYNGNYMKRDDILPLHETIYIWEINKTVNYHNNILHTLTHITPYTHWTLSSKPNNSYDYHGIYSSDSDSDAESFKSCDEYFMHEHP